MQYQKDGSDSKKESGRWSKEQHERFMLGLMQHGKNWKKVQDVVATRSGSQVRSHAQKFFNKIQKCSDQPKGIKQKKKAHNNQEHNQQDVSFTENNDIIRSYDQDNSLATPLQIISLIKKESVDNRKVNLSSFKKSLEENQEKHNLKFSISNLNSNFVQNNQSFLDNSKNKIQEVGSNITPNASLGPLNSFKSMNNIISAYQALNETDPQNRYQDQSFLIGLTKKYKKYFSKGGQFQNLIDFGNPHQVAKAAQMQKSLRKKSWTLAQGVQGDQNDLQVIKKKLKQNQNQSKKLKQYVSPIILTLPKDQKQKQEKSSQKQENIPVQEKKQLIQQITNKQSQSLTKINNNISQQKQKQSTTENQKPESKEHLI